MARRLEALPDVAARLAEPDVHFVVTGGGGWLGRAALEILAGVYGEELGGRVSVFGERAKTLVLRSGRCIQSRPLSEIVESRAGSIILHFAYLTRGHAARIPFDNYVSTNRSISSLVAETAAQKKARGIFLPSSGAVYRKDRTLDVDLCANPYGVLKLEDEARFGELRNRFPVVVVIFRIFNLSGPFMNHSTDYALGSILLDILGERAIRIGAPHPVVRSYTHVGDLLNIALSMLVREESAGPLDAGGRPEIEIGELARRAARLIGKPNIKISRPQFEAGSPDIYTAHCDCYYALASAVGLNLRTLDEQIVETAEFLRGTQ
jgi:UDP-glucuronate decarboxylase